MSVVARIAGIPSNREADPHGLLDLLVAAFLGACFALALSYLLRSFRRVRAQRLGANGSRVRANLTPECEQIACGLKEFAKEVEGRLDSRLDLLEKLLKAADIVLRSDERKRSGGSAGEKAPWSAGDANSAGAEPLEPESVVSGVEGSRETNGVQDRVRRPRTAPLLNGELRGITEEERDRVLDLAAVGESPEAISQAVGLLRGEVDLILRLFGRETPG